MAYENLEPYRDEILKLRRPGPDRKTLQDICDLLFERHKLRTTPGTLSRYITQLKPPFPDAGVRSPTPPEQDKLEAVALLNEVLVEVRGRSEEQRAVIEHLAGQVAVQTRAIEELEKAVAKGATAQLNVPPEVLRRIWVRALSIAVCITAATVAAYFLFVST
jgi:hypothetical protein